MDKVKEVNYFVISPGELAEKLPKYQSSQVSDQPVHLRSLTRVLTVCIDFLRILLTL